VIGPAPRDERGLAAVSRYARQLLDSHGLDAWVFRFDRARVRAGSCRFRERHITLAREFARLAPSTAVEDTLLHEIAHALAGPRAGHGPAWQRIARAIGCSAERCHRFRFTEPRWLMRCVNGCFESGTYRRRRDLVCRRCRKPVVYGPWPVET
jgi:predicted SprT family Zn-dependent metalloprotease